ncbi:MULTISPECIES: hypothetical protein [Prevotellaceae]|jgi:hypothetical protein|uniref:hypothetical protein n=1 Tax=Prevotellaceae TaxID=171552 RepID=UPI0003D3AF90|nr:hypothetical protein [Prevotella phocaeensis]ETD18425.1 hypothetical protein HMPREF1199_01237 [Hoylesella oralis CC98A]
MLQRDYIMRLIREFMAALERFLNKKEVTDRREEIKKLYEQYVGPYALYHNATIDEVMAALQGEDEEHRFYKMQILAELFNVEADIESKPFSDFLLEKSYALFDFIDKNGKEYSLDRRRKMETIRQRLDKA